MSEHPTTQRRASSTGIGWLAVLACVAAVGTAGCDASSGQKCDTSADCDDGYECVSSGGVVFGSRICLLSSQPGADAGLDADTSADAEPAEDTSPDAPELDAADDTGADAQLDGGADADGDVGADTCTGAACGPDDDGDGVPNAQDGCPQTPNPGQKDRDGDGTQDACDDALSLADADAIFPGTMTTCCSFDLPWRVMGGGDVTGDGVDDVLVAGHDDDNFVVWIIDGASAPSGTVDLGSARARFARPIEGDLGFRLGQMGDFNGDGIDDFIVGHPGLHSFGGRAYLFLGGPQVRGSLLESDAAGVFYEERDDRVGFAVDIAPDLNGDGKDDAVVAEAYGGVSPDFGRVHIIFGSATPPGTMEMLPSANADIRLEGQDDEHAGWSVAGVGDVDGDGFGDLLVGAPYANSEHGVAYLVRGKHWHPDQTLALAAVGARWVAPLARRRGRLGEAVAPAGDVDGDGLADFLIGEPQADSPGATDEAGAAYLVFGDASLPPAGSSRSADTVSVTIEGGFEKGHFGAALAAAGDADADGFDDVLVAAPDASGPSGSPKELGAIYLITEAASLASRVGETADPASLGTVFWGGAEKIHAGAAVAGGGDIDDDGRAELLFAAPGYEASIRGAGAAFLFYGL